MNDPRSNRGSSRTLWMIALTLVAFVAVWPLVGGIMAVNDDIKFVRVPMHRLPLLQQLTEAWQRSTSFRPMELLVAWSCDERTLRAWLAVPVQVAGLALLLTGVMALARALAPGRAWVAPIALAWVMLSPGTTCAVWQIDSGSQTWSAALGTWACVLAWRCMLEARRGRAAWGTLALLTLVFALGVNIKETFYGWSAGIGLACIGGTAWMLRNDRASGLRASLVLWPVVALPVAHMATRWLTGAMSQSMQGEAESRYQLELGMNLLVNSAQSVAGSMGTGPFYLLADENASIVMRALAPLAGVAELLLLLVTLEFAVFRADAARRLAWMPVMLAFAAGMVSLAVTFPMGSVSELYGFGANVMVGLLLGYTIDTLWNATVEADRRLMRVVVTVWVCIAVPIGLYGLAGRAHAFWATWQRTRSANEQILSFIEKRPAAPKYFEAPLSTVYFQACCRPDRSYGAYIMPVAQAIDVINTVDWMVRNDPKHPTSWSVDQDPPNPSPYELVVRCADMPPYGHW